MNGPIHPSVRLSSVRICWSLCCYHYNWLAFNVMHWPYGPVIWNEILKNINPDTSVVSFDKLLCHDYVKIFIIPPLHRRWKGGILDSPWCLSVRPSVRPSVCPSVRPSVRPSVCPSVGKVSATFRKNYWLDSFHPWDLYLWGKSLDPYRFSCSCPHFWPSGGQKMTENRGFRNFSRKLSARFISSLGFILMG